VSLPTGEDLTSHIYVSQRLRLHYVTSGNPGAPPLLLLHGGQDHCRNWVGAFAAESPTLLCTSFICKRSCPRTRGRRRCI
jgi:hypothetical protein